MKIKDIRKLFVDPVVLYRSIPTDDEFAVEYEDICKCRIQYTDKYDDLEVLLIGYNKTKGVIEIQVV